jgi:endo-1,4-beta-xylanase
VLEDLGAAEQPAPVTPAFTVAADAADPYHTVDLTLTNYGTLLTTYPSGSLQVQAIVQTLAPGTAQSGTVVMDVPFNMIANATFSLPAVAMGATVWYRANARPGAGALPSVWTSWTSITLGSPGAITALTATPGAGGTCALAWTNPDADLTTPIAVWLRTGPLSSASGYSVILSSASFTVTAGQTFQLSATTYNGQGVQQTGSTYNWTSTATGVATVSSSGLVTAVAAGTATIEATDTTAGRGSPVGESFATVDAAAAVQQVIVTPSTTTFSTGASPFTLAVTVYDVNGNVVSAPAVTVQSSNTSIATVSISGTTITVTPAGSTGSVTITASCGGVNGTCAGTAVVSYANLAQAARASQHKYLLSVVQAYPNDNFAYVGGQPNTSLGLPNISTNYGNFTPGDVTGKVWPELLDINGVLAFGSTATASTTNNAAIASISTQIVVQVRARIDEILALAANGGAGLFCIGTTTTSNKKLEAYLQIGSTAGEVQLTAAAYETGSVRTTVTASGYVNLAAFPLGCWLNLVVAADTSSSATLQTWIYDDNGVLWAHGSQALSTALNTDGGANGCFFLNQAFNTVAGPTVAMRYGGLGVMAGTVQATPARWQPANAGTSGIVALYLMGDATSGSVSAIQHTYTGINFTTSGTVTGVYDNGGPYNWLLWNGSTLTSGPGGECTDENQWKEFHFIAGMTGPSSITFNYGPDPTVAKCRSLGILSRGYLFQGSAGAAIPAYAQYVTSAATATQALQAIVTGMVGRYVAKYGTAAQGGIRVWNIANEFMYGGVWQNSIWYQYLGSAWVADVAAMVYAIDPTAIIMVNLDQIELASNSAQQAAVPAVLNAIIAKGIPASQVMIGHEFHLDNVHQYTQQDAEQFASYVLGLPAGTLACLSEPDITDVALPGTGASSRSAREVLSNETWQMVYGSYGLALAGVWARMWGTGAWEKSSLTNWLNVAPPAGASRTDGDFEESSIVDENYNPYGGAYSSADIYGTEMQFLGLMAASAGTPQTLRLAGATRHGMTIGVGGVTAPEISADSTLATIIPQQFSAITCTALSMSVVEATQGTFVYTNVTPIATLAAANGMKMRASAICDTSIYPSWISSLSATNLKAAITTYCNTVMPNYPGLDWPVVNEPINASGGYTSCPWQSIIGGPGYIEYALTAAHTADSTARLWIDDYSVEWDNIKVDALYNLCNTLVTGGYPLYGVAFEGHFTLDCPTSTEILTQLQRFTALGLKVRIAELDCRLSEIAPAAAVANQPTAFSNALDAAIAAGAVDVTFWCPFDKYPNSAFPSGFDAGGLFSTAAGYPPKATFVAALARLQNPAATIQNPTATLWKSGLETEDNNFNNEWDILTNQAHSTITVQSSVVHSGSYAGELSFTSGTEAGVAKHIYFGETADVWVRAYVYFPTGFALAGTSQKTPIIGHYDALGNAIAEVFVESSSSSASQLQWLMNVYGTGTTTIYAGTAGEISTGTWYEIKYHYTVGTGSNGGGQFWVNTVSKGSNFTLSASALNLLNAQLVLGYAGYGVAPAASTLFYFDDVAMDSSDPGN